MKKITIISRSLLVALILSLSGYAQAGGLTLGVDFAADYTVADLGSISGLPGPYGGLTLLAGDANTLLIGGGANSAGGGLYTIGVERDVDGHIIGFTGTAAPFGTIGEYNDGGVVYGPGGVLFTAQWPVNMLGQTSPGSTDEDRIDDLGALGVTGSSIAALGFVPPGFAGAGGMKVVSWSSGNWYDISYAPDGSGTYDLLSATQIDLDPDTDGIQALPGGPEGFVFIAAGNAGFTVDSLLVSDYSSGRISAYVLDAASNPLVSTRRDFLTGLSGAEGAFIDPLTGDFLFSTFGGGDRVVAVRGFMAPPQVPVPAAIWFMFSGLGALMVVRGRNRKDSLS